jgi:CyaY protein
MTSATEFHETVDALFEQIVEMIDESEVADDAELNQGVLEITCIDQSKIIINRHAPTQEIWVAAKSGGYHFRWANGVWLDTRSGERLSDAISRVVFEQTGQRVSFD